MPRLLRRISTLSLVGLFVVLTYRGAIASGDSDPYAPLRDPGAYVSTLSAAGCPSVMAGDYALVTSPLSSGGAMFAPRITAMLGIPSIYTLGSDRFTFPFLPFEKQMPRIENDFAGGIVHGDDVDRVIRELKSLPRPRLILPGGESSVELTERIMIAVDYPYRNDPALLDARVNKWDMGLALEAAGLEVIDQALCRTVDEALRFRRSRGAVVLKPSNSVGTDQVYRCDTDEEVRTAFGKIHGRRNRNGKRNDAVLAQELLEEVQENEFIVDTVSSGERHRVFIMGRYHRFPVEGAAFLLSGGEIIGPRHPRAALLREYAFKFLDALGVKYGPAHLEIVLARRRGTIVPLLVDYGGRLGGTFPSLGLAATGRSVVDWTIQSHLDPDAFFAWPEIADLERQAGFVTIHARADGSRMAARDHAETERLLREVHEIRSLHKFLPVYEPGTELVKTRDLSTMPIIIELAHPDASQLARDIGVLRRLDDEGFFVLAP